MRGLSILTAAVAAALCAGTSAMADTFLPGNASVRYAANSDGFFVSSSYQDRFGASSWAESAQAGPGAWDVEAGALPGGYADAGLVLYGDGSLTLGQLQAVSINVLQGSNTIPTVNLWLDTGGDGHFFSFSGDQLTGTNGDAYFNADLPGNITTSTTFDFLGGPGSYGQYTLAQLQSGARAGINANTKVALWVGVTNGDYFSPNFSDIGSIDVRTTAAAAAPLPSTAFSGLALLAAVGSFSGLKRLRRQTT